MNGLDGARLQLEVGERVILIGAIIDAGLPGLVRKGGMGQRTQGEQGAHEKVCQPKAKAHLKTFPTSLLQRSQLISPDVQWPLSPLITERECWPPSSACAPSSPPLPPGPRQALPTDPKARAGSGAPHHRDDDVRRDGHAVLAGADGSGAEGAGMSVMDNLNRTPFSQDGRSRSRRVLGV